MDEKQLKRYTYIKKAPKRSNRSLVRTSIIFGFIFISTLISVLLPVYFALLPLQVR